MRFKPRRPHYRRASAIHLPFIQRPYHQGMEESFPPVRVPMDGPRERRTTLELVLFSLLFIGGGIALNAWAPDTPTAAITALGDVKDAHLVEIRNSAGAVVVSGEFRTRVDGLGNIEKDAELVDQRGRTVIGEVELELPAAGREHRRAELEVDVINLQPRQRFTIVIDDRTVGSFMTDDRGSVDHELQEGETAPRDGTGLESSS
jgi:hypothetical protein